MRCITAENVDADRVKVTLTTGVGQTVDMVMPRERYADLLRLLDVRDVG